MLNRFIKKCFLPCRSISTIELTRNAIANKPLEWNDLIQWLENGQKTLLWRDEQCAQRYIQHQKLVAKDYRSINDFIRIHYLKWNVDIDKSSQKSIAVPSLNSIKEPLLTPNDFPYYLIRNIQHWVIWCDPKPKKPEEIIEQVLNKEFPYEKFDRISFVNPPRLRSMKRTQNDTTMSKRLRTTNSSLNTNDQFEKFINKFRSSIETNNTDSRPFDIFKQYLKECLDDTSDSTILPTFIKKTIQLIVTSTTTTVHHLVFTKIVGLIIIYLDNIASEALLDITYEIIDKLIQSSTNADIMIELLRSIYLQQVKRDENQSASSSAASMCQSVVQQLGNTTWTEDNYASLIAIIKTFPFSDNEKRTFIDIMFTIDFELNFDQLPIFVLNILKLCNDNHSENEISSSSGYIFDRLIQYFINLDKKSNDNKQYTSNIRLCIVHILNAIELSPELGTILLRTFKKIQSNDVSKLFSPFCLAFIFALPKDRAIKGKFIKQLKTAFDLVCQTFEKNNEAFWLILFTKINYNDFYRDYLLQLAKKDLFGGDLILSGLIDFCFQLLDDYSQSQVLNNESSFSVIELLKTLASKWLSDIVRLHKSIQEDVIHRLFDRILEAKTNDRTVKHFIEQLYDVMKTNSHRFVKWPEHLKDRLDQILYMRYELAHDVLDAFKPIIKLSGNTPFRETYFQLLRTAMYRPRLDCRRMAVDGYLILLKHAKWLIRPPAAQASQMTMFSLAERGATQMNTINSTQRSTEGQCIELLMQLRRSLTQQYDVRLAVYEGLLPVLRKSPILMAPILDMLISQIALYYEPIEDRCTLNLLSCLLERDDKIQIIEPFAHLLHCLCLCLHRADCLLKSNSKIFDEDPDVAIYLKKATDIFKRLIILFDDDEFTDSVGVKGLPEDKTSPQMYTLCIDICNVLIEYKFMRMKDLESTASILKSMDQETRLNEKMSKAKLRLPLTPKLISFTCLKRFLHSVLWSKMFHADLDSSNNNLDIDTLIDDNNYRSYVMRCCLAKFRSITSNGIKYYFDAENMRQDKLQMMLIDLHTILYQAVTKDMNIILTEQILQLIVELWKIIVNNFRGVAALMIDSAMKALNGDPDTIDSNISYSQTDPQTARFAESFKAIYKRIEDEYNRIIETAGIDGSTIKASGCLKALIYVADILELALKDGEHIDRNEYQSFAEWVSSTCMQGKYEDHQLSKALVRLLFKLSSKTSNHAPLLRKVAMDIHGQCEDVSEDTKFVHQPYFAIINEKTHMVILNNIVLIELERMINSLEWIIQTQNLSNDQITHFCGQLSYSMTTFGQILQCRLKNKMMIIHIVKLLTKLYTILDEFTRQMVKNKTPIRDEFEKLASISGSQLQQPCYGFLTYTMSLELDDEEETTKKKKKKIDKKDPKKKKSVLKDTLVPKLVFEMEQYERSLLELGKQQDKRLLETFKMSAVRDFRFNLDSIPDDQRTLQTSRQENEADEEEEEEDGENE
ncbi:unnamed protein product [Adineta steineri]|uniref:Uncharacterized protein n=1 Tax=Adineta steineri TaxID=433720 RepID=A0A813RHG3_9BILA|nr:unnamed protein product [Adineta steineri]CAF0935581.1 unnamed protein product [Adineta steineri]